MTTLLVTGASRGLGLEHVRQALAAGEHVIAACRDPAKSQELQALSKQYGSAALRLEALDVASGASIDALAARLVGVPIDTLINNAGIYGRPDAPGWPEGARVQSLTDMDYALWEDILRINVMGPFRATARLLPNIQAGARKLVVMMSSDLGSIANNNQGTSHAYRSSKAALNMITRGLSTDLKNQGITVISLAPGWTRTALGGGGGDWATDASVTAQRQVLAGITAANSGQFIDLTGKIVAW